MYLNRGLLRFSLLCFLTHCDTLEITSQRFYSLENYIVGMYYLCSQLPTDEHSACFQLFVTPNNANLYLARYILIFLSFFKCYFGIDTWKWDFWVKMKMKVKILQVLPVVLYRGYNILPSHHQGMKRSVSPKCDHRICCQSLGCFFFANLKGAKWYLTMVLNHLSLNISKMEHVFICLRVIYISFFMTGELFLVSPFSCSPRTFQGPGAPAFSPQAFRYNTQVWT